MTTAVLRVTAGAAMVVLYLLDALPDGHGFAGLALGAAAVYSGLVFAVIARTFVRGDGYSAALVASLTVLDNVIILGLAALTGGVGSLIVAILLLVVTTNAARYGIRVAVVMAVADSVVLFAIAHSVTDPDENTFDDALCQCTNIAGLLCGDST